MPVSSAVQPHTLVANSTAHRLAANSAAPNAIVPALAARTQRVRSSAGSSTGAAIRRVRATSSAPITNAAPSTPSVAADVQPHVPPWTSASARAPVAPASRTAPARSGGAVSAARDSRRRRAPSHTVNRPTGTLMTKIQRQLPASTSRPPSGGPSAAATALTAPQAAIAAAHFCGGKAARSSASAAGIIAAAAAPCTLRAAISTPGEVATAQAAEARAKTATPRR